MPLVEHLLELRGRLTKALAAVVLGGLLGLVFYDEIFAALTRPFRQAVIPLAEAQGLEATINFDGIADPFTVPLRIALLTGLVVAAPVWIYQLWAFVVPALYRNERRWALSVLLTAVPLFVGGVLLGYFLLPNGLRVILSFTPVDVTNIVSLSAYLNFVIRLLLVFGVAFLLPVFLVLLNAVGVLSGRRLSDTRRWLVLGIFLFAAVATPTGDPVTMLTLAVPMWVLFEASVLICRFNDRRRARAAGPDAEPDYARLADDETSRLTAPRDPSDDLSSQPDGPSYPPTPRS